MTRFENPLAIGLLIAVGEACARPDELPSEPGTPLGSSAPGATAEWAPSALGSEAREAWLVLAETRRFTDDAIYYQGATPKEVVALRILWREPAANEAFHALLRSDHVAGRLYALCGLYYTDAAGFERALAGLGGNADRITFQTGCSTLNDYPVPDLVELDRADVVRLERRDQSIRAWKELDPRRSGFVYDIAGGGFPNLFREAGGYAEVRIETLAEGAD